MREAEKMRTKPDDSPRQYDCFICYRRSSGYFPAKMVRDRLEAQGISCFLDLDESSADRFHTRLYNAIEQCEHFLVVLTRDSLNQCVHEQDWVRKEIEAAQSLKKEIIPLRADGFVCPAELRDVLPESIQELELFDSVTLTTEYFDAAVERLISFLQARGTNKQALSGRKATGDQVVDFFCSSFDAFSSVQSIDMMFHAGDRWNRSNTRADFLNELIENKVPVRILINSENAVLPMLVHMRKKLRRYLPIQQNIKEWKDLNCLFPRLQVHVCKYPFFHRLYLVRLKNGEGRAAVKNYRYGENSSDKKWIPFEDQEEAFQAYREEFDFIWTKLSRPVSEY